MSGSGKNDDDTDPEKSGRPSEAEETAPPPPAGERDAEPPGHGTRADADETPPTSGTRPSAETRGAPLEGARSEIAGEPRGEDEAAETATGAGTPPPGAHAASAPATAEASRENGPDDEDAAVRRAREVETPRRRGGFFPLLLGGIVAGLIGFVIADYATEGGIIFPAPRDQRPAQLATTISEQGEQISALQDSFDKLTARLQDTVDSIPDQSAITSRIEALQGDMSTLQSDLSSRVDQLSGRMDGFRNDLSKIAGRVSDVEQRPISERQEISGAVDSYERELDDLRTQLDQLRSDRQSLSQKMSSQADRISSLADKAQSAIQSATEQAATLKRNAAATRVSAAVESGEPFAQALGALGDQQVPDALSSVAQSGVATLSELQASFPQAARDALAAARESDTGGDLGERVTSFLRSQVGARSLEPTAGNGPDAVLSRAQGALADGDLPAALDQLSDLSETGRKAMSDWIGRARTRLAALRAARQLGQSSS